MGLNIGDRFPEMSAALVGGETVELPGAVDTGWAVVLFYRGHW